MTPPRITGIDAARSIALLGMLGAHVGGTTDSFSWSDPATWQDLVHGAPAILFAFLSGISLAIMTGGARVPAREELGRMRLALLGRAATIFAIGVALEMLGTAIFVILWCFGVYYIAMMPVVGWHVRRLVLGAVALAAVGPAALALFTTVIPNPVARGEPRAHGHLQRHHVASGEGDGARGGPPRHPPRPGAGRARPAGHDHRRGRHRSGRPGQRADPRPGGRHRRQHHGEQ